MKKIFSATAIAALFTFPIPGSAADRVDIAELQQKIITLSQQLDELKAVVAAQAEQHSAQARQNAQVLETVEDMEDTVDELDERAEGWDLASRFQLSGDFRARYDYYTADSVFGKTLENDSILTNRLRLNIRAKATENIEFKGRLAMYKTWGDQSAFHDAAGVMYPVFDGNVTRTPAESSALYVDRAFVNWNGIAGLPVWFSIGRRPTTDGMPANLRLNNDSRMATPMAFMDWPFDGLSLGYAYNWTDTASGRVRFCYGRGFEQGLDSEALGSVDDMDFAGLSWDVLKQEHRFLYVQSFMAFDVINYPNFQDPIVNTGFGEMSGMGPRRNLGNIWHTSGVFMDRVANFNYFLAGGWSQSRPNAAGMFNDPLDTTGPNTDDESGFSLYAGIRYDFDNAGLKIGLEYNHGSEYWLAMAPGHDEIYQSKLATRGDVWEIYTIWNLPAGEKISKYAKTFIRFGYQHYEYDYFGSGDWNMAPYDLGSAADQAKLKMMGLDPVESADQIYLTFEAYF